MDFRIELIPVPVTDVDRAITFYTENAGFNLDHDHQVSDDLRFVQLTPPGSACSIVLGTGITDMTPGTQEIQMVVSDINEAHDELSERQAGVTEIENLPWGDFVYYTDPDGNKWSVQAISPRSSQNARERNEGTSALID